MKKTEPIKMTAEEIVRLYPDGSDDSVMCIDTIEPETESSSYHCTRNKDHVGNHVAYGIRDRPLAMWRDKTLLWERNAK